MIAKRIKWDFVTGAETVAEGEALRADNTRAEPPAFDCAVPAPALVESVLSTEGAKTCAG